MLNQRRREPSIKHPRLLITLIRLHDLEGFSRSLNPFSSPVLGNGSTAGTLTLSLAFFMHKFPSRDPRTRVEMRGRGSNRWSQAGKELNCAGGSGYMHKHSVRLTQTPSATDLCKAGIQCARPGQRGSEKAAATCMQRAKSCLSGAWSCVGPVLLGRHCSRMRMCLHREIQHAQRPTHRGHQLPVSIQLQAWPGSQSDFCPLMAILTNQLPIQPPPWCCRKRKRGSWEEVKIM